MHSRPVYIYARRGLTWGWGYCLSPHPYIAPLYSPLPCKCTAGLYMPDVVLHGSGGTVYHPIPTSHPCTHPSPVSAQQACTYARCGLTGVWGTVYHPIPTSHPCTHPSPVSAQQACICQTWSYRGLGYCLSPHPYIAPLYSPLPCKCTAGLYMPDVVSKGFGVPFITPSHPCMHPVLTPPL